MNQTFYTTVLENVSNHKGTSSTCKLDPPYKAQQNFQVGPCISPPQAHHAEKQSLHLATQAQDLA
jgi:hypothetical protein